ncbi:sigma-70 family RNA polymerase sigma factor [Plastorhodobacter daqingensis]|uniref:Sigma-70 family RNA polymerase sigma factor n=1 Tax=Plastorhodobacter daqingensis TaxID=1387281 RepID=A0ABW2UJ49_9RHOB
MRPGHYPEGRLDPEALVTRHMELVRRVAWHIHGRVGHAAEIDDLLQAGYIGLVDASHRYVRRDGVSFASYAAIRIRGAIIDHLRRNSNLCRTTIAMHQRAVAAQRRLEQRLQRIPTNVEIAAELELDPEEYSRWAQAFEANSTQSLDAVYSDQSPAFEAAGGTPEDALGRSETAAALRAALATLPEREAMVLQLYYVEELNVYEIAAVLGVTTGRVSQIKKAAVDRLRDALQGALGELF